MWVLGKQINYKTIQNRYISYRLELQLPAMDGDTFAVTLSDDNIQPEIPMDSINDGFRVCPLCQSAVRLFFINFNEKMLMCENTECEFPYGHEELQFFKEDNEGHSDEEVASVKASITSRMSQLSPSLTGSVISTAAWQDIDRINKVYESEDSQMDLRPSTSIKYMTHSENDQTSRANIESVEEKTRIIRNLMDSQEEDELCIRISNEKWIKNLKDLQQMSGYPLLKPEEVKRLPSNELDNTKKEMRINIDTGEDNSVSCIKIEITNKVEDTKLKNP